MYGLEHIFRPGFYYKKAGVILQGISSAAVQHQSLFTTFGDGAQSDAIMQMLDGLNTRFGRGTVSLAAAGIRNDWQMKREKKTPNYTTQWDEIPVARAH